jgi:hypothetical protein
MKKYLIKGALALFTGAFLFSCAEKESEYVPLAQQKVKAFDEVFKEVFGDNIDPYQDWGFNSAALKLDPNDPSNVMEVFDVTDGGGNTRAGIRTFARTRAHINVNGNEWETIPEVTEAEATAVFNYVNKVKKDVEHYMEYPSQMHLQNYWVTQVWTGSDKYTTWQDRESTPNILGSSKMNYLHIAMDNQASLGPDNGNIKLSGNWEHINNFNAADNRNYGGNTLVENGGTYNFVYHSSEDNNFHDKWIAIDGQYITDATGVNHAGKYYICFDFVSFPIGAKSYFKLYVNEAGEQDGTNHHEVRIAVDGVYGTAQDLLNDGIQTVTYDGKTYTVDSDWTFDGMDNPNQCVPANEKYTDWIIRLVSASKWTPVPKNEPHQTVVEYWTPVEAGRVFCEDLGRASREDLDYNDLVFDARTWRYEKYTIDWNWHYNDTNDANPASITQTNSTLTESRCYADIKLLAAGGTIPITILNNRQVHSLFDKPVDIATMVNTRDNNSSVYGSFDVRSAIEVGDLAKGDERKDFTTTDGRSFTLWLIPGYEHIKDIPIVSSFDGNQVTELNANQGEAPHKILVEYGETKWVSERKNLALAYPNFSNYVTGQINETGWVKENVNPDYLYNQPVNNEYSPAPMIIKSTKEVVGDAELEIWSGTQAFGSNWNYASMDSPYDYYNVGTKFYPGDRIRFHGIVTAEGDGNQPYITVSFVDDSNPYLVDTQFAERQKRMVGDKEEWYYPSTAYVEILLDEYFCSKLNNSKNAAGQLTLHVQGRGFTLTKIGYVPFD